MQLAAPRGMKLDLVIPANAGIPTVTAVNRGTGFRLALRLAGMTKTTRTISSKQRKERTWCSLN